MVKGRGDGITVRVREVWRGGRGEEGGREEALSAGIIERASVGGTQEIGKWR